MSPASAATRAQAARLSVWPAVSTDLDGEWAADHWEAARLGVPARRGAGLVRFDTDRSGLAPRSGEALVPIPPGHRLRL